MTKFSWKDAPDLIADLTRCQNSPCNANQDILTFAGFCESLDELELYVAREEIRVQNYEQDQRYARVAARQARLRAYLTTKPRCNAA